jgi:hypothetical protein
MSTVNDPLVTVEPEIVMEPQILLVEPGPTFQVPSSDDDVEADPFEVLEVVEADDFGNSSLAGAGPSMKWM